MKVRFEYEREKDVWCLLNKGKSSNNSQKPTKAYERLVAECGEHPSRDNVVAFIERFSREKRIDLSQCAGMCQKDWDIVADEYQKRAEAIFGVPLPHDIVGYLTINSRCPYNIKENSFFVSAIASSPARATVMHELWHFYTWYGLGSDQEEKLGRLRYNDIKEALTVLLNVECADLMPTGAIDRGYPQHAELREQILRLWVQDRNILPLWEKLTG